LSKHLAVSINALGQVYRMIGDYQKALDSFKRSIKISLSNKDPNLPIYYFDLARIQKITNNLEQAYQTYQKSNTTGKKIIRRAKPEKHKFYEQIIYNCNNDLSEIELTKGDSKQAKQYHRQALQVLKDSKSPISNFFEAYKRFEIPAKMWVYQKKYIDAIDLFKKAKAAIIEEFQGFEVGKDLANILHQMGECYTALNQHQEALQTYQHAVESRSNRFTIKEVP